MVYAVRADRPMVAKTPVKRTRKNNDRHEQIKNFLLTHDVSLECKDDASGELIAIVREKNN